MKKIGLLVLVMLGFAQVSGTAADYSKMSANELNEALIIAVKKGSSDEVQKLVQAGANGNQKITYTRSNYDYYDSNITCSLLEYAAKHGYVDIVKELTVKAENDDINTALIEAAKEGYANVVRELIQAGDAQLGMLSHIRCLFVNSEKCKLCTNKKSRDVALMGASRNGNIGVIKELIKAGANVNHADVCGNTALIEFIECSFDAEVQKKDKAEIIQALLKAKANVNHANKDGDTALIIAIEEHDFDAVQILLNIPGININYADNDGNTALIRAIQCIRSTYIKGNTEQYNDCLNSQDILEKLLQTPGINPYHVNKNGDTAITLLEKVKSRVA